MAISFDRLFSKKCITKSSRWESLHVRSYGFSEDGYERSRFDLKKSNLLETSVRVRCRRFSFSDCRFDGSVSDGEIVFDVPTWRLDIRCVIIFNYTSRTLAFLKNKFFMVARMLLFGRRKKGGGGGARSRLPRGRRSIFTFFRRESRLSTLLFFFFFKKLRAPKVTDDEYIKRTEERLDGWTQWWEWKW